MQCNALPKDTRPHQTRLTKSRPQHQWSNIRQCNSIASFSRPLITSAVLLLLQTMQICYFFALCLLRATHPQSQTEHMHAPRSIPSRHASTSRNRKSCFTTKAPLVKTIPYHNIQKFISEHKELNASNPVSEKSTSRTGPQRRFASSVVDPHGLNQACRLLISSRIAQHLRNVNLCSML